MHFFLDFSTSIQTLLVIVIFGGGSIAGLYLVRKWVPAQILREDHEVAGYTFGVVGAFYGVVLAFVIVAAWQRFERANTKAQAEALALTNLYSLSRAFPEPIHDELVSAVHFYADQVVHHEWNQMASMEFEKTLDGEGRLWRLLLSYNPKNAVESAALSKCMDEMDMLSDARQLRYVYYHEDLPSVVWLVIYAGCIITIGFSYFFGSRRFRQQALMCATFAVLIGLTIMAITELADPYQGAVTVTNEPFEFVLTMINSKEPLVHWAPSVSTGNQAAGASPGNQAMIAAPQAATREPNRSP